MAELRVYLIINWTGAGSPTATQWRDFFAEMRHQTMSAAILATARAAHNRIAHKKRSLLGKIMLVSFEIAAAARPALLDVLDVEAAAIGASGTNLQKFEAVLQAEVRQGALDAGATQTQADKLDAAVIAIGDRVTAIAGGQQYLRDMTALWHEAE